MKRDQRDKMESGRRLKRLKITLKVGLGRCVGNCFSGILRHPPCSQPIPASSSPQSHSSSCLSVTTSDSSFCLLVPWLCIPWCFPSPRVFRPSMLVSLNRLYIFLSYGVCMCVGMCTCAKKEGLCVHVYVYVCIEARDLC